jgi:hypothetical protein
MPNRAHEIKAVRLHLTNIVGLGAVSLFQSLLPALVTQNDYKLEKLYLPAKGALIQLALAVRNAELIRYKRYLPNAISRMLECTLLGGNFDGATPLLIFGDLPIRCKAKQTVFVQTSLLIPGESSGRQLGAIKYWIARWLFRRNQRYVTNFIVQTEAMRSALIAGYPEIKNRIHVIAQPAPNWLIDAQLKRTQFLSTMETGLRLFYPAAPYPHKNHRLLTAINKSTSWPISELTLTIPDSINPNREISWIKCVDRLNQQAVIEAYRAADALLFLSISESFGFPLVEAMWVGLPIICPNLPYARALCGDTAIYFDPSDVGSLHAAVIELSKRRAAGWWPDWSANLEKIPRDWDEVAEAMLALATADNDFNT